MPRSHNWNAYNNHVDLLHHHLDRFNVYFDESADHQTHHHAMIPIDANTAHEDMSCPNFNVPKLFYGVHVLRIRNDQAKISWQKSFELRMAGGRIESRTKDYSYNISWQDEREDSSRIIRFDNKDDGYGFDSPHHFHCEIDPPNNNPPPFHVGENFPHLSDIFEWAIWGLQNGFKDSHQSLLKKARAIRNIKIRKDPTSWYPDLSPYMPPNFEL